MLELLILLLAVDLVRVHTDFVLDRLRIIEDLLAVRVRGATMATCV